VTELLPEHFEARELDGASPSLADRPEPGEAAGGNPPPSPSAWQSLETARAQLDEAEQEMVRRALGEANGVVAQAARTLGIARTTLSSRLDVLGLRGRGNRDGA
jgi:transcriptional regulator with GAF, ATPase, and Fis domain